MLSLGEVVSSGANVIFCLFFGGLCLLGASIVGLSFRWDVLCSAFAFITCRASIVIVILCRLLGPGKFESLIGGVFGLSSERNLSILRLVVGVF